MYERRGFIEQDFIDLQNVLLKGARELGPTVASARTRILLGGCESHQKIAVVAILTSRHAGEI